MNTINQNNTGCITWCQNQTNRIAAPLPPEKKFLEVIKRILILITIIIPLIGLIANCFKSSPNSVELLKEKYPLFYKAIQLYQSGDAIPANTPANKTGPQYLDNLLIAELGNPELEPQLDGDLSPPEGFSEDDHYESVEKTVKLKNASAVFKKIRDSIGLTKDISISDENLNLHAHTIAYFASDRYGLILALKIGDEVIFPSSGSCHRMGDSLEEFERTFTTKTAIQTSKKIVFEQDQFNSQIPEDPTGILEANVALFAHILPKLA